MKDDPKAPAADESRSYSAPALEKGLDILEMLCRSEQPLSQKDIAKRLGRSVGEIYRMMSCLVNRNYVSRRTGETDSSISLQLELKGLSNRVTAPDDLLDRGILGYRNIARAY